MAGVTPEWNAIGMGEYPPWDTLILNGEIVPGRARVTGGVGIKLDVQPVKGSKGAKTVNNGPEPAAMQIEIRLLTIDEVHRLEEILEIVHPRKDAAPGDPVTIVHPSVNFVGVVACRVTKVGFPQIDGDEFVWTFEAVEWFPAAKVQKQKQEAVLLKQGFIRPPEPTVPGADEYLEDLGGP